MPLALSSTGSAAGRHWQPQAATVSHTASGRLSLLSASKRRRDPDGGGQGGASLSFSALAP